MVCVGVTPDDHALPLFLISDSPQPGPLLSQEPWGQTFDRVHLFPASVYLLVTDACETEAVKHLAQWFLLFCGRK